MSFIDGPALRMCVGHRDLRKATKGVAEYLGVFKRAGAARAANPNLAAAAHNATCVSSGNRAES
ncbi:hypothetical protein [Leporid alphaherpesvirus 4]|uniref:Uncharacterized protein n=1 Tax=Leporid alphaherpesvirus 4 TaxID=481315 RepID=J9QYP3_9ALPH|nr:hypothetical protein [Leporid alphaherpesvirus 4]AFR32483.1 hypothetical protein [Leporid alphaherpesvirus 4]